MSAKRRPTTAAPAVTQPRKQELQKRLARIEGQVRGVAKMVEEDRYCIDVLTQVAAVRSALLSVALELLRSHTHGCVQNAIATGHGDASIDELMLVLERLAR